MKQRFAFGPRNYRLMFIGLAVLAAGFITMTLDTTPYGEGFLGITLGPILLFIGFLVEFWAIMAHPGGPVETPAPDAIQADLNTPPATPAATATSVRPTYKQRP